MRENCTIIDNVVEQRYETDIEGDKAIVEYIKQPDVIILTHTYVPPKHEGKGIASKLTRAVLEDVRSKGLQVVPQCDFTAKYILRHPEWEELVIRKTQAK